MVEKEDFTTGKSEHNEDEIPGLKHSHKMSAGGYGEEKLPNDTTDRTGSIIRNDVHAGGRDSSGDNIGHTWSQESGSMEDAGTFNSVEENSGTNAPSMGSSPSNSYDIDADRE